MSRLCRKKARVFLVAASSLFAIMGVADPAWAHITVHPRTLPAGSKDVELTFRVPNERDNANTVKAQVFFPTDLPLLTVDVLPIPGWVSAVHTRTLSTPIQTDDGPVSQVLTDVTWTASSGGISPGQYEDFVVAAGSVPSHAGAVVFKALQTYSTGEIVRWIELATAQDPHPQSPAPVLTLTSGAGGSRSTAASGGATTADILATTALVLSIGSVAGMVVLTARSRRKTRGRPDPPGARVP
jgi:uncharacterized protein YcnI